MNKNRWIFFVGIILGLLVLSYKSILTSQSPADRLSNQLIAQVSKKLNRKYGLRLGAIGGSLKDDKLNYITVYYNYYSNPLSVDTSRMLVVNVIEEYLQTINNNEELKPYLLKYPFTVSDLHLSILLYTPNGDDYYHPDLGSIRNTNRNTKDQIEYATINSDDEFVNEILEDYDKALEIVKKNHQLDVEK